MGTDLILNSSASVSKGNNRRNQATAEIDDSTAEIDDSTENLLRNSSFPQLYGYIT